MSHNPTRRGDIQLDRCLCGWSRTQRKWVSNGCKIYGHSNKTRAQLIADARLRREEIEQYFTDVASWNDNRGQTEGVIEPDPCGSLKRIADALDKMLAKEVVK